MDVFRRYRRHFLASLCLCLTLPVSDVRATDEMRAPPSREAFASPGGAFEFCVEMTGPEAEWAKNGSTGSLYRLDAGERQLLWTRPLPQAYRPRFALVSDHGEVVLLDQWINVAGPHAVTVLDASGEVIASHSFADVADALGVPGREIVPLARFGPWMSAEPRSASDGRSVRVATGGRMLRIDFATGSLKADSD